MWMGKYKRKRKDGVIAKGMDRNGMGGTGEGGSQLFRGGRRGIYQSQGRREARLCPDPVTRRRPGRGGKKLHPTKREHFTHALSLLTFIIVFSINSETIKLKGKIYIV